MSTAHQGIVIMWDSVVDVFHWEYPEDLKRRLVAIYKSKFHGAYMVLDGEEAALAKTLRELCRRAEGDFDA